MWLLCAHELWFELRAVSKLVFGCGLYLVLYVGYISALGYLCQMASIQLTEWNKTDSEEVFMNSADTWAVWGSTQDSSSASSNNKSIYSTTNCKTF